MATTSSYGSRRARARALGRSSPRRGALADWTFVEALMGAEVDAICGAAYHHASPERTNRRKRHRSRPSRYEAWHHPSSKIPKLREGSYLPDWIQERRRRSEVAPTSVIATCLRARGLDTPAREAG